MLAIVGSTETSVKMLAGSRVSIEAEDDLDCAVEDSVGVLDVLSVAREDFGDGVVGVAARLVEALAEDMSASVIAGRLRMLDVDGEDVLTGSPAISMGVLLKSAVTSVPFRHCSTAERISRVSKRMRGGRILPP